MTKGGDRVASDAVDQRPCFSCELLAHPDLSRRRKNTKLTRYASQVCELLTGVLSEDCVDFLFVLLVRHRIHLHLNFLL